MAQTRQDGRFQAELARILIRGEEVLFERNFHSQVLVNGAINRRHPTLPQDLDNAIAFIQQRAAFHCHDGYIIREA